MLLGRQRRGGVRSIGDECVRHATNDRHGRLERRRRSWRRGRCWRKIGYICGYDCRLRTPYCHGGALSFGHDGYIGDTRERLVEVSWDALRIPGTSWLLITPIKATYCLIGNSLSKRADHGCRASCRPFVVLSATCANRSVRANSRETERYLLLTLTPRSLYLASLSCN